MESDHLFMNKLYILENIMDSGNMITAAIRLQGNHHIFKGHFPGNPILPGVCTIQIIKELIAEAFKKKLQLTKAGNIKYLSFINPLINNTIQFEIKYKYLENDEISSNVRVYCETVNFCSFKGEFKIADFMVKGN